MYNGDSHKAATLYNDTFINVINTLEKKNLEDIKYRNYLFSSLKKNFNQEYWKNLNKSNKPTVPKVDDIANYKSELLDMNGNMEEIIVKNEEKEIVFNWLKRVLSEKQYSILFLSLNGWSYEAIGKEKNISISSVRGHLERIKTKVRENYMPS